jgi:hypothetical protein
LRCSIPKFPESPRSFLENPLDAEESGGRRAAKIGVIQAFGGICERANLEALG